MGMILMPGGGNNIDLDVITAVAADVIIGKVTVDSDGNEITGTIPDNGTLNWSAINTAKSIEAGYYSGGAIDSRPSYSNGYNAGRNAAISGISYAQVTGTTGGGSTVDTNVVTVPAGKTRAYICVGLSNPRDSETYPVLNGVRQGWTLNFSEVSAAYRFAVFDVSEGSTISVHSQRQNTSNATYISGVVLFV